MIATLDQLALKHGTDKASNLHDYCHYYETYFASMRYAPITLIEVGVHFGPSIRMWLDYFLQAMIVGVDIERQDDVSDPRYTFIQGDATNPETFDLIDYADIMIDDGSHYPPHYSTTFGYLWPKLVPGGYYVIEDIFATYYRPYKWNKTWLLDLVGHVQQNGKAFWGMPNNPLPVTPTEPLTVWEREIEFIHFYKGLAIMKKRVGEPNLK